MQLNALYSTIKSFLSLKLDDILIQLKSVELLYQLFFPPYCSDIFHFMANTGLCPEQLQ